MVIHNIDSPEDQHKYAHEMYTSACSLSDESVINQYAEELKKAERNLKDHLFREYFKATF